MSALNILLPAFLLLAGSTRAGVIKSHVVALGNAARYPIAWLPTMANALPKVRDASEEITRCLPDMDDPPKVLGVKRLIDSVDLQHVQQLQDGGILSVEQLQAHMHGRYAHSAPPGEMRSLRTINNALETLSYLLENLSKTSLGGSENSDGLDNWDVLHQNFLTPNPVLDAQYGEVYIRDVNSRREMRRLPTIEVMAPSRHIGELSSSTDRTFRDSMSSVSDGFSRFVKAVSPYIESLPYRRHNPRDPMDAANCDEKLHEFLASVWYRLPYIWHVPIVNEALNEIRKTLEKVATFHALTRAL